MIDKLPLPTEEELKFNNKSTYMNRIIQMDHKFKIDVLELSKFAHYTYTEWKNNKKHINIKEYKKF